eukprot:jgi/Mesvir1/25048/Mv18331-RA.1
MSLPANGSRLKEKLLVLDVNGLLMDNAFKTERHLLPCRPHDAVVNNFYVYRRPHCEEFIKFCLENFVCAVWTSARRHNMEAMLDFLFGAQRERLLFCWDQSYCTDTGQRHPDNPRKPLFLKELAKVWALPHLGGRFGPHNTLLIDDSEYKGAANPVFTGIFPPKYHADSEGDGALGLGGFIRSFLDKLLASVSPDLETFMRDNPFTCPPAPAKQEPLPLALSDTCLAALKKAAGPAVGPPPGAPGTRRESRRQKRLRKKVLVRVWLHSEAAEAGGGHAGASSDTDTGAAAHPASVGVGDAAEGRVVRLELQVLVRPWQRPREGGGWGDSMRGHHGAV